MKLQDFVSSSIEEIVCGISQAQDSFDKQEITCALNPSWKDERLQEINVQTIEFDIAISAASSSETSKAGGVKVGIEVLGANLSADRQMKSEESTVSRVKFSLRFLPQCRQVDRTREPVIKR